tara:strand:+ start:118 stop:561 length:444 start_codon:yes stop_codon:yes gene_type:complete
MKKLSVILSLTVGILGLVFLAIVLISGDDLIEMKSMSGSYNIVSPIIYLAIITLISITSITIYSSLNILFNKPENLKKVGISIAVFLFIVIISYVLSEGVETPMKDGKILSAGSSRIVETGIRTFYFLVVIALGLMLFSGLKKRLVK